MLVRAAFRLRIAILKKQVLNIARAYLCEARCDRSRQCLEEHFHFPPGPPHNMPVTFHEFVRTIARMKPADINEHFRPQTLLCDLGSINYTYIGEIENGDEMDFLSLHIGGRTTLNNRTKAQAHKSSELAYPCTEETVESAARLYASDAKFLGYDFTEARKACVQFGQTSLPELADDDQA
eukprot:m.81298 g.81298  ORF g.81298 m.81298 type:complete len:180 (+) comp50720_c1_seq7:622-1161(+)